MIDARDLREKDNLLKIPNDKPGYYKWFELDFPIKSEIAKEKLHKIERELLSKNLYILNIQENKFEQAKPIKTTLKRLRKESKKVDNEKYM